MIDQLRLVIVATLIPCFAAVLIAFTHSKTADRIILQQDATQTTYLQMIVPDGAIICKAKAVLASKDTISYWNVIAGLDTLYVFQIGSWGYSGIINYLVCVDTQGIIGGMAVINQRETPGLGARIQEARSKRNIWNGLFGSKDNVHPWFTEQFRGISINNTIQIDKTAGEWYMLSEGKKTSLLEKNRITAITGSTISTRTVINGLNSKAKSYLRAARGLL